MTRKAATTSEIASTDSTPPGRAVGGIDFAAIWGTLDHDDVHWIVGERYRRETPPHQHRDALKSLGQVVWYCDPSGATERAELRAGDLKVIKGDNDIKAGIMAVNSRVQTGRLRVSRVNCPDLLAEARLYRYPSAAEKAAHGENPIDENNHALGALRHLVSRPDSRFIAKLRGRQTSEGLTEEQLQAQEAEQERQATAQLERSREAQRAVFGVDPDLWTNEDVWS